MIRTYAPFLKNPVNVVKIPHAIKNTAINTLLPNLSTTAANAAKPKAPTKRIN